MIEVKYSAGQGIEAGRKNLQLAMARGEVVEVSPGQHVSICLWVSNVLFLCILFGYVLVFCFVFIQYQT